MSDRPKPYVPDYLDCDFEETLAHQPYFSYNYTDTGYYHIHSSIIDTIQAWAGLCTDPNEGIHSFNNQTAMFAALDLIYKLLDEAQRGMLEVQEHKWGELHEFYIPKITEKKHDRKLSETQE